MNNPVIKVENLSKRYRIGAKEVRYKTLREAIIDGVTTPIRNYKRLQRLTKFEDNHEGALNLESQTDSDVIWALNNVSFDVYQGEVVGIIGRNGAGKSTLLKILSRITKPTSGQAEIYGRVGSLF